MRQWLYYTVLVAVVVLMGYRYYEHDEGAVVAASASKSHHSNKESCLICHTGMTGFSPAHDPDELGCAGCHLGDKDASEKALAHKDMIVIPGNLSDASMTCSTSNCHVGVDVRVSYSLMNTMSGVVGVDRYVFGETDSLDGYHDIKKLGHSAADTHLRNLCASCHLGQEKTVTGPVSELSRGGGCNACHLNYSESAISAHAEYQSSGKKILPMVHPTLSLQVGNEHCFGCHSRSGRLSTNYEGWHETQLKPDEVAGKKNFRVLGDERVFTYIQDDVHHARGMDCIDCHSSMDVMGAGVFAHQDQAVQADCRDCHTKVTPPTLPYAGLSEESQRIVRLRGIDQKNNFVVSRKLNTPLVNVFLDEKGQLIMRGKNSKKRYSLTPPGAKCTQGGVHEDVTCSACHTNWAPQCISCHTSFDKNEERYDLLEHKYSQGAWVEKGGHYLAGFPALGVVKNGGLRQIKTFIPGMVMTLDKSTYSGKKNDVTQHRLYAPTSAHTIASKGQGCRDCHNNPVALGYGRGELKFSDKGKWLFDPRFPLWEYDGLPVDAWIGFLKEGKKNTTRSYARSFNLGEQQKILRVGSCLTCHQEDSEVVKKILVDFDESLRARSDQCLTP